ncbi:MAG: PHB depolymerase family esterase [Thioalkalispiraceae bacterium]|jgi:polyhydroxybutyrate depolymerase
MRIISLFLTCSLFLLTTTTYAQLQQGRLLTVDDIERSYDLYVPETAAQKRPLVLLYHGHFGSSDVMTGANGKRAPYKIWLELAERDNFLVAIPNGEKGSDDKRGWNDCRADAQTNPTTDDVKFTAKLIEAIDIQYPIDHNHIYATGTSNGGNMVIRLAMEVPEIFAAVAAVVASNPRHNKCMQKYHPISILFMNGTSDPFLPYHGGQVGKDKHKRGTALSTPASVEYWIKVNATENKPEVYISEDINKHDDSSIVRYTYKKGKANTAVVLYEVRNGGHTEPSLKEQYRRIYKWIVGNQNQDIEMANEVWNFFKTKSRTTN